MASGHFDRTGRSKTDQLSSYQQKFGCAKAALKHNIEYYSGWATRGSISNNVSKFDRCVRPKMHFELCDGLL